MYKSYEVFCGLGLERTDRGSARDREAGHRPPSEVPVCDGVLVFFWGGRRDLGGGCVVEGVEKERK